MIRFDDARRPAPTGPMESPGGFVWWYLELLDQDRNGLVLIWSFGLPFLPGYVSKARRGQGDTPRSRPSLNLAVYEGGEPSFYLLREFEPEEAEWDGAFAWRFGDTHIEGSFSPDGSFRTTTVSLDCPVEDAGVRVVGTITAEGPVPRGLTGIDLDFGAPHDWTPVAAPAHGHAVLSLGDGPAFTVSGEAYHDRNASPNGLHDLGIDHWAWGHTRDMRGHDRIFYILWPEEDADTPSAFGIDIAPDGLSKVVRLDARLERPRRTFYGMATWDQVTLFDTDSDVALPWMSMSLAARDRVDNGPFYLRYLPTVSVGGQPAPTPGSLELIRPSRIDMDRHRFLVNMRVARPRKNSMWLPLFQGQRQTRLSRLARRFTQPAGAR